MGKKVEERDKKHETREEIGGRLSRLSAERGPIQDSIRRLLGEINLIPDEVRRRRLLGLWDGTWEEFNKVDAFKLVSLLSIRRMKKIIGDKEILNRNDLASLRKEMEGVVEAAPESFEKLNRGFDSIPE